MLNSRPSFNDYVAAVISLTGTGAVVYLAVMGNDQMAGGVLGIVAAAVGYYLRGRIEKAGPTEEETPRA